MSDHSNVNVNDGSKGRFGSFKFWYKSINPQTEYDPWANSVIFTQNDPRREHVCRPVIIGPDGRAKPLIPDFSKHNHNHNHDHRQTKTVAEEGMQSKDHMMMNEPKKKKGFPANMFQNEYREPEPGLTSEGGWDRPSPAGWKLAPEETLSGSNNAGKTIDIVVK